jgi:monothiol glutaredoxin
MKIPIIRLSDAARRAIQDRRCGRRRSLTITISDRFEYELRFDARTESDIAVDCGAMTILLDPPSAQRADGLSVDVVTGPDGSGFIVDNPNQPPGVRQLSAPELKAMIESGRPFELVDVRTEEERAIAKIEGSRLLDADGHRYLSRPRSQHDRRVSVPPRHPQPVRRRVLSA